jgi:hypothetical protein
MRQFSGLYSSAAGTLGCVDLLPGTCFRASHLGCRTLPHAFAETGSDTAQSESFNLLGRSLLLLGFSTLG